MIEEGSIVFPQGVDDLAHGLLSKLRGVPRIADDLAAEYPEVVDMFLNRLFRQARSGQVKKKRREALDDLLTGYEIPIIPHPASRPLGQVAAVGQ